MIAYIFFLSHGQSHPMFTEMLTGMLCQVDKELANAARSETSSVLRARGYDAMNTLSFTEIIKQIQTLCPTVFSFPSHTSFLSSSPEDETVQLALIYGMIMFNRCKEVHHF